ncbi:DUF5684 domain-containing protein [Clostridium ganghwense]|uniref:DUF5684 domain-containing protein n=2 Tax=Clostridium ganghwense TaxID=312089 RepID=A0ABT4CM38_9CLOT|nr:DUF5684 domain-containing protein [Clostridium ganghwense]
MGSYNEVGIANFRIALLIITYFIQALTYYKLAEKAKLENRWIAFIPILQFILFFHIINRSAWYILFGLLALIPFVGPLVLAVLSIYWSVKFYQAFGIETLLIVIAVIIPFVGYIVQLYMAFSESVEYQITNEYQVY